MRIAQVAPLYESVPPRLYGGTERVVAYLTEELVRQGHDVTLFASGDSITTARLLPQTAEALRLADGALDHLAHHILMLEHVMQRAEDFDLIHYHIDYLHFPWSRRHRVPSLTTLHGRLDLPDLVPLYQEFKEMPVVSISDSQRKPLPWLNWQGTVYHGLPPNGYHFRPQPGDYLAFVGRISPEKGVDRAILIAKRAGIKLRIAAKVDRVDREYFEQKVEPLLEAPYAEYIGEVDEVQKDAFLGKALALLLPLDWEEPFGLAMIESLACGTPVVAFRRGSVPELIEDGATGYIVDNMEDAVEAVRRAGSLDRQRCRQAFERRFRAARMAHDYVRIYERLCGDYLQEQPFAGSGLGLSGYPLLPWDQEKTGTMPAELAEPGTPGASSDLG